MKHIVTFSIILVLLWLAMPTQTTANHGTISLDECFATQGNYLHVEVVRGSGIPLVLGSSDLNHIKTIVGPQTDTKALFYRVDSVYYLYEIDDIPVSTATIYARYVLYTFEYTNYVVLGKTLLLDDPFNAMDTHPNEHTCMLWATKEPIPFDVGLSNWKFSHSNLESKFGK